MFSCQTKSNYSMAYASLVLVTNCCSLTLTSVTYVVHLLDRGVPGLILSCFSSRVCSALGLWFSPGREKVLRIIRLALLRNYMYFKAVLSNVFDTAGHIRYSSRSRWPQQSGKTQRLILLTLLNSSLLFAKNLTF